MSDDMQAKLAKLAEEHSLAVEWKGDDYGARKQYYKDMFLAGAALGQRIGRAKAMSQAFGIAADLKQPYTIAQFRRWLRRLRSEQMDAAKAELRGEMKKSKLEMRLEEAQAAWKASYDAAMVLSAAYAEARVACNYAWSNERDAREKWNAADDAYDAARLKDEGER